jgi:hypothetical protein
MLKTVGFPSTKTGDQTIVGGNLVIGTANKGVDFSSNPSAPGMTSELFNDYEEGTWTPTDASGGALTLAIVSATYTKVGRLVVLQAEITYPTTASSTGAAIGGLPFTPASNGASSFYAGGAAGPVAQIGSALYPANSLGAGLPNSTLSAKTVYITASYRV